MSSIPRYVSSHGRYYKINDQPEKSAASENAVQKPQVQSKKPPAERHGSSFDILGPLGNLDSGDVLLLLVLFFLYKESGDEEFLITLIVLAFSIFKQ